MFLEILSKLKRGKYFYLLNSKKKKDKNVSIFYYNDLSFLDYLLIIW